MSRPLATCRYCVTRKLFARVKPLHEARGTNRILFGVPSTTRGGEQRISGAPARKELGQTLTTVILTVLTAVS
eukprot:1332222-Rhodomonas_salina.1